MVENTMKDQNLFAVQFARLSVDACNAIGASILCGCIGLGKNSTPITCIRVQATTLGLINVVMTCGMLLGRELKAMARAANFGMMWWSGRRPGIFGNILEMVRLGNKALAYFSRDKAFYVISNVDEAMELLGRPEKGAIIIDVTISLPYLCSENERNHFVWTRLVTLMMLGYFDVNVADDITGCDFGELDSFIYCSNV